MKDRSTPECLAADAARTNIMQTDNEIFKTPAKISSVLLILPGTPARHGDVQHADGS